MIMLTRINKVDKFYLNHDKIEFMEETPDTVISLESGKKVVVMESIQTVIEKIIEYKRRVLQIEKNIQSLCGENKTDSD